MRAVVEALAALVGPGRVRVDAPLAPLTTFRVGGPADVLVETVSADELAAVVKVVREAGVSLTVLGGGSNVLVADGGIRGVVVRPRGGEIRLVAPGVVRADAPVTINGLVRWTITRGLGGLEAWAGTPGTVGGAVYGNAHWGGRNIGDLVDGAALVGRDGCLVCVSAAEMGFAYDQSRLQETGEVLLWATFRLTAGRDPAELRHTARASLAYRKRTQPLAMPSAGCIFRNPDPARDRIPEGMPASAGALIDRAGLKGRRIGGAVVSGVHANFIVNDGSATAADILRLAARCRETVREHLGVTLELEIVVLGEGSR